MKDTAIPVFSINKENKITIKISLTDAQLADQGYTFNEAGQTFNEAGVEFGGVYYRNQDVVPMVFTSQLQYPKYMRIYDIYTHPAIPPGPNNQIVVGCGWFLYIAQV